MKEKKSIKWTDEGNFVFQAEAENDEKLFHFHL